MRATAVAVAVVVVALAVAYVANRTIRDSAGSGPAVGSAGDGDSASSRWERLLSCGGRPVERRPWPGDQQAVFGMMEEKEPVVLVGSPAAGWPAATRWTPEYLAAEVGHLPLVQVSETGETTWRYWNDAPWSKASWLRQPAEGQFVPRRDFPTAEFFEVCRRRSETGGGPTAYYAGNLGGGPVLGDVGSPRDLFLAQWADRLGAPGGEVLQYVWLGCAGVSAHPHTDAHYNLYGQIRGRKRFLLLPPAAGSLVRPYPRMHPGRGQSSANWTRPDPEFLSRLPELESAALCADLGPGDLLYLPPFWWHFVSALTDSASVSMWVVDPAVAAYESLSRRHVPARHKWTASERAEAVALFLLRAVGESVLRRTLADRYRGGEVGRMGPEVLPRSGALGEPALVRSCRPAEAGDAERVAEAGVAARVDALRVVEAAGSEDAARELLSNYVEDIVAAALDSTRVRQVLEDIDSQCCVTR